MKYIISDKDNLYLIDDIDADLIEYVWTEAKGGYLGYTNGTERKYLHIEILKKMGIYIEGYEGDHRDRDVRNNQRENLRIATRTQNLQNMSVYTFDKSSKYKGVNYRKDLRMWQSRIGVNGTRINLGLFNTEREAALRYNKAAKHYFKEFAVLNEINDEPQLNTLPLM